MGIFASAPTYNPDDDIPSLKGKVILVTGSSSGIGYETVAELVKHGAKVYMAARYQSRATGAISNLKADGYLDGPNAGEAVWLELDLGTPATAQHAAEQFLNRETRLDVLINNAAIGPITANAYEPVQESKIQVGRIMSTNHIGPFAFTNTLLPLLKKTAVEPGSDVRIVSVSSNSHEMGGKVDWKSSNWWNLKSRGFMSNMAAYGTTKLAGMLFMNQLQCNLDEQNVPIVCISLHPGGVNTEYVKAMSRYSWFGFLVYYALKMSGQLLTPAQGAYTTLFAATSPKISDDADRRRYAGAYLTPFAVIMEPLKEANDPVAARDMWETTERVISQM